MRLLLVLAVFAAAKAHDCLNGGEWWGKLNRCLCPAHRYGSWCQFSCGNGRPEKGAFIDRNDGNLRYFFSHCACARGWSGFSCEHRTGKASKVDPALYEQCHAGGTWDVQYQQCKCNQNRYGAYCQFSCGHGQWAYSIKYTTMAMKEHDFKTIKCVCLPGYSGAACSNKEATAAPKDKMPDELPITLSPGKMAEREDGNATNQQMIASIISDEKPQVKETKAEVAPATNPHKIVVIVLCVVFVFLIAIAAMLKCYCSRRKSARPPQPLNVFTLECMKERERVSNPNSRQPSPSTANVPLSSPFRITRPIPPAAKGSIAKQYEAERAWATQFPPSSNSTEGSSQEPSPPPSYSQLSSPSDPNPRSPFYDNTTNF